jgi:hypothetical protein
MLELLWLRLSDLLNLLRVVAVPVPQPVKQKNILIGPAKVISSMKRPFS